MKKLTGIVLSLLCTLSFAQSSNPTTEVTNFISWQSKQPNPFGSGTIGDAWAKSGITDPYNNQILLKNAKEAIDTSNRRVQLYQGQGMQVPSTIKPWENSVPQTVVGPSVSNFTGVQGNISNQSPAPTSNKSSDVLGPTGVRMDQSAVDKRNSYQSGGQVYLDALAAEQQKNAAVELARTQMSTQNQNGFVAGQTTVGPLSQNQIIEANKKALTLEESSVFASEVSNPFAFCSAPKPCKKCQPLRRIYEKICPAGKSSTEDIATGQASSNAEVNNFINWQSKQPNPFGIGTIGDAWAKSGITDPYNNQTLLNNAKESIDTSNRRVDLYQERGLQVPSTLKPWESSVPQTVSGPSVSNFTGVQGNTSNQSQATTSNKSSGQTKTVGPSANILFK